MTEKTPVFENLNTEISYKYIYSLLEPYREAISIVNASDEENAIDSLKQQIMMILPGEHGINITYHIDNLRNKMFGDHTNYPGKFKQNYYNDLIPVIKILILSDLGNLLINYVETHYRDKLAEYPNITPWDLAYYRDDELTRLFGPSTNKLPIIVVNKDGNRFQHYLTEEFVYGMLWALEIFNSKEIQLIFMDEVLNLDDFGERYEYPDYFPQYYVINDNIYFETTDVVQGISTIALWLGQNPHSIIKELKDKNGNLLTF